MTQEEFIKYLRVQLYLLEGMASMLDDQARRAFLTKVLEIRRLLNEFARDQ